MAEVAAKSTEHAGWRTRPGALLAWLRAGEFNPVFVKEMRQAVRGQLVLGGFLATLFVMFSAYAWQLFTTNLRERGGGARIHHAVGVLVVCCDSQLHVCACWLVQAGRRRRLRLARRLAHKDPGRHRIARRFLP